jgi:cobalt/nickel transport system permease protein
MAHLPDGVLSWPVLAAGAAVTAAGCAYALRRLEPERIPELAVLCSLFFVAALVHFPVGPSSVHLILNGLTGIALGWAAFPAILVALVLQALLFGFGGLVVLGVNAATMAVPAVLCGLGFRWVDRRFAGRWSVPAAALAGAGGVLLTALAVAAALAAGGREFLPAARLIVLGHLPVMVIEAFFTAAAVGLLLRVRPEFFGRALALAGALALLAGPGPALAHKLKVFATAEGATVIGYAYFNTGARAQAVAVRVTLADGDAAPVFEGRTDAEGGFQFTAGRRADHLIVVEAEDGHGARFTVSAAELPETLPGPADAPAGTALPGPPAAALPPSIAGNELRTLVEAAVARQLRPLREQLDAEQAQVRGRDLLGGLGWIIGMAGLAYGLSGRRRSRPPEPRSHPPKEPRP